jgi:surfactin synthase thioesterase subunit
VLGSVAIGALFGVSLGAVTAFAVAAQLAAVPFIVIVRRRTREPPVSE